MYVFFKAISPSRQNFDSVICTNPDIDTQLSKRIIIE